MSPTRRFALGGLLAVLLDPVSASAGTLRLAWDPNPEPDIARYEIFYGTQSGVYQITQNVALSTTWQFTNLTDGLRYYFAVRACNTSNLCSELSVEISDFPVSSNPHMAIDLPTAGATLTQPFRIGGWAIDQGAGSGTGVDAIHVWAHPTGGGAPTYAGSAAYGGARPDIGSIFGSQFTNSGYNLVASGLVPGTYQLVVYAFSTVSGGFNNSRAVTVTVRDNPRMSVDLPADGSIVYPGFRVAGWALDLAAASGTGVDAVHVWAHPTAGGAPTFAGSAACGGARPDVGAVYGSQFTNSGYDLTVSGLAAGTYQIVVYAHSTVAGTFNQALSVTVTVRGSDPLMAVDVPVDGSSVSSPFVVAGWALDRAAPSGTGVDAIHVWAHPTAGGAPTFAGSAAWGGARPDVGAVYGSQFTNSGYGLVVSGLAPGTYELVVYAHSTVTGTFSNAQLVRVTVI